jgi:uncharacterized delta-60 repeat protein
MKKNFTLLKKIFILSAFLKLPLASMAQDGSLDFTFGTNGIVTTSVGTVADAGESIAVQNDGKILVAGTSFNGSTSSFLLTRYNSDGSLDNTFDSDGIVTTHIGISYEAANCILIQNDGKILVTGPSFSGSNNVFALARYNSNGSLDSTFSNDGIVTTSIGTSGDYSYSAALQIDSKIIVSGTSDGDFALVRYNQNGSLDDTFGSNGIVTTAIGNSNDVGYSMDIQVDGKVVVAGSSFNGLNNDFALVRYNINGSIDSTFGYDGKVITEIGANDDLAWAVKLQANGKIVVVGQSNNPSEISLVRYNTNGSLDSTFASNGIASTIIGVGCSGYALIVQSNEKILVAGNSSNISQSLFTLIRYNENGSLDTSFSSDGIVTTAIGTFGDYASSLALQSDDKIVLAGSNFNNDGYPRVAVARYNNTNVLGINMTEDQNSGFSIYPNPFYMSSTLKTDKILNNASLIVRNTYGQQVKQLGNLSGQSVTLNRGNLLSGIYFVQLIEGNEIIGTHKLVMVD